MAPSARNDAPEGRIVTSSWRRVLTRTLPSLGKGSLGQDTDKDKEEKRIARILREVIPEEVIPEILREIRVKGDREEGSMAPTSTPRATTRERRRDRRKREQQKRNRQEEEMTKTQQREDPPPLEQRPRMERGMVTEGNNPSLTIQAATEETTPAPQKETLDYRLGEEKEKSHADGRRTKDGDEKEGTEDGRGSSYLPEGQVRGNTE